MVPVMHIVCNSNEAMQDARVLQTELSMTLGGCVTIPAPETKQLGHDAKALVVLLTKESLRDAALLVSLYSFAVRSKTIIPMMLIGRGYDYKAAMAHLADLRTGLTKPELAQLVAALAEEVDADGKQATVDAVQSVISSTLPRIIAVNWEPEAGKNQLDASVSNVIARYHKLEALSLKLPKPAKLPEPGKFSARHSPKKSGRLWGSEARLFPERRNSETVDKPSTATAQDEQEPSAIIDSPLSTTDSPLRGTGSPKVGVPSDAALQPAAVALGGVIPQPLPAALMESSDAARDYVRPLPSHPTPPHTVQALLTERVKSLQDLFGGPAEAQSAEAKKENNSRGVVTTTTTAAHIDEFGDLDLVA